MLIELGLVAGLVWAAFGRKRPKNEGGDTVDPSDDDVIDADADEVQHDQIAKPKPTPKRVGRGDAKPTKPTTKPAPKPAPKPERVGRSYSPDDPRAQTKLTDLERTAAVIVCKQLPNELPDAPGGLRFYEQGTWTPVRGLDEWLAFVTFASLYILPTSPWVSAGNVAAPWGVVPGWGESPTAGATWRPVYMRLVAYCKTLPKGVPAKDPAPKPLDEEDPFKAGAVATAAERTLGKQVLAAMIDEYPSAPLPDQRKRGARSRVEYATSVTFWALYADPETSDWQKRGGEAAPWRLPKDSKWIPVYLRIQSFLLTLPQPKEKPPLDVNETDDVEKPTATEKTAVMSVWAAKPQTYDDAPEPGMRTRGTRTQGDWAANVVYWALYADPQSGQQTYAGAPWKAGESPKWTKVWKRIRNYIATLPGGT